MLMLSGPVELLFLVFINAVCICSGEMVIGGCESLGFSFLIILSIFLLFLFVLWGTE